MHSGWNFLVDKPPHRDNVSFIEGVLLSYLWFVVVWVFFAFLINDSLFFCWHTENIADKNGIVIIAVLYPSVNENSYFFFKSTKCQTFILLFLFQLD